MWLASCFPASAEVLSFAQAKKRADQGDAFAQAVVAMHYQIGWETEKNIEQAVKYATASAKARHAMGFFRVGAMIRNGEGFAKNKKKGLELQAASYNALKEAKDPYSITATAMMIFQGKVVGQYVSENERRRIAAALYKRAADMGYAPAQFNYAICAQEGHGMAKNEEVRKAFIAKAAEQDYPLAKSVIAHEFFRNRQHDLPDCHLKKLLCLQSQRGESTQVRIQVNAGHAATVTSASINEAAGVFVTGTRDGEVITWDLDSRRPIARFSVGMHLGGLELQNNGYIVCVGGEYKTFQQELKVYESYTGRQIGETLFTSITGEYSNAYRPSVVLTKRNALLGVNTDNTIALTLLSSFVPESLFKSDSSVISNLILPAPKEAQGKQILHCWISEEGRQLAVVAEKLKETLPPWSLSPWDNATISEKSEATVHRLDLDAGEWASGLSSDIEMAPRTRIMAEGGGKSVVVRSNNKESSGELLVTGGDEFVHELCLGMDTPRVFYDNASQLLTSGDSTFSLYDFVARPAPFSNSPYQWRLDNDMGIGWASFVTIKDGKRLVSYESIDLSTNSVKASIPPSEQLSGVFALGRGAWSLADASGALFSANGTSLGKKELGFDALTVSTSETANTMAFGGHSNAVIFALGKVRKFSQDELSSKEVYPDFVSVSPNGERVALAGNHRSVGSGLIYTPHEDAYSVAELKQGKTSIRALLGAIWISDKLVAFVGDSACDIFDSETAKRLFSYDTGEITDDIWSNAYRFTYPWRWASDQSNQRLFYQRRNGFIDIIQVSKQSNPTLIVSLYIPSPHKWALLSPDNYYMAAASLNDNLHFVVGSQRIFPFEQFDLRLNRPDIVFKRLGAPTEAVSIARQLREKRLKRMGITEDMLKPDFHLPEIEFLGDIPVSTADRDIEISIKAQDTKYPLERLKIFVNNVPINGRDGESLREANIQSLVRSIPIKLGSGRNKIQVSVLNSAGAESLYANAEITCTAERAKPRLFAVAMGVSEYANSEWNLKYAAKDAKDLIECIRSRSAANYGAVKELLLTDSAVTKESMVKIREFLSEATIDDTVLLFVAGHGLLDAKYDYYFGTSDVDFKDPSARGIAYEEFDDLLASLPSLKKSLLIDTCHAGELDEEEKQMLASTQQSSNQVVAMLPSGARGMSVAPVEGARGKSEWYDRLQGLFVDLRRGSGSTILSSSAGAEYALESSDQKNGLFTYAVLEAMEGKGSADVNKDSLIQMTEITQYVKKRVSDLSNNKQTPNIRRVNLEGDFAVTFIK